MNPEFSRVVSLGDLAGGEVQRHISADSDERAAIARRLGLVRLDRCEAQVALRRLKRGRRLALAGRLQAEVVQTCVVSLEPFSAGIEESFSLLYAAASGRSAEKEVQVGLDDADSPEPLVGNEIDIGEVVTQHLALALDPYPRKPGATIAPYSGDADETRTAGANGPFADLATRMK